MPRPKKLSLSFYNQSALDLAQSILGKTLVHHPIPPSPGTPGEGRGEGRRRTPTKTDSPQPSGKRPADSSFILPPSSFATPLRCRIVETEAYLGPHDLASHASKGPTRRNAVMFGPHGHAYVYFIYGMYTMLNIVCGRKGEAQAILIRAAEPLDGWDADLSGPGKLARALQITMADNGLPMTGDRLYLEDAPPPAQIARTTRVGVDYSGDWARELLRFYDPASPAVSRIPKRAGK
jgi:DNA-3-methyladenine glycosylase